jgi:hypothetical protein
LNTLEETNNGSIVIDNYLPKEYIKSIKKSSMEFIPLAE